MEEETDKEDLLKRLLKDQNKVSVSDEDTVKQGEVEIMNKKEEVGLRKSQEVIKPPIRLNL